MAAPAPPPSKSSSDHFSILNLISRFRSRRKRSPVPIKDARPPLRSSPLPLVLPEHQRTLSQLGWTTVTFPQPRVQSTSTSGNSPSSQAPPVKPEHATPGLHPLQNAYEDLFSASQTFFDLPDHEKERWKTRLGSEEGWSKIPGEKEFITLRTSAYTPDVLRGPAKRYWALMGAYLDSCLGRIERSLGIDEVDGEEGDEQGLRRFVGPCKTFGEKEEDKTATMLRLFRYEGWEEKVVAEPHADLGLLSIVVGNVPGLEVWNSREFLPVEKSYTTPCATLLGGRQLEKLTNGRYPAGGHRVVSYGRPDAILPSTTDKEELPKYRFSIVFVLRAHEPVTVDSDLLETEITGKWKDPVQGVTAGVMYEQIRNAHFNINTGLKERDEQRRKLEASKKKQKTESKGSG